MTYSIAEALKASTVIDVAHSRIQMGGHEVAYHCDKFATRITKGLEDVMGVEKASELIAQASARNNYNMFSSSLAGQPRWATLGVAEKLETMFEIYRLLGFGAVKAAKTDGSSTTVTSATSYLAEGYFENMQRWQWPLRQEHFCHEMCGCLQAAFALATGKDLAHVRVVETRCRTTGGDLCEFAVEVK